jgi:hypothetical protein
VTQNAFELLPKTPKLPGNRSHADGSLPCELTVVYATAHRQPLTVSRETVKAILQGTRSMICYTSKNTTSRSAGQKLLKLIPSRTGKRECIEISRGFSELRSHRRLTLDFGEISFVGRVSNESFRYSPISDLSTLFGENR